MSNVKLLSVIFNFFPNLFIVVWVQTTKYNIRLLDSLNDLTATRSKLSSRVLGRVILLKLTQ